MTATARHLNPALTLVVRFGMYGVAAFSLASAIATLNEIGVFDDLMGQTGRVTAADLANAEGLSEGFVTLAFWVGVASAGATVVWWYRAHQAIGRSGVENLRWSPGWAVGGWFIPGANVVIPKLVLNEIDRVSQDGGADWRDRKLTRVSNWWWGAWVVGVVLSLAGSTMAASELVSPSFDASAYRGGLVVLVVGFGISCGAGFLGAATMRILGERLHPEG